MAEFCALTSPWAKPGARWAWAWQPAKFVTGSVIAPRFRARWQPTDGRFIPTPGGVLILNPQGIAIGAIGISGDDSDKDEFCAIGAIKTANLGAEPAEPAPDWKRQA